jgi:hypothetical protein
MRKLFVLVPLLAIAAAGAALAGPWDASFARYGQIASTSPTSANLQVPAGSFVRGQCDVAGTETCQVFRATGQ